MDGTGGEGEGMSEYKVLSDDVQITWQRIRQKRIDFCQVGSMHPSKSPPTNRQERDHV